MERQGGMPGSGWHRSATATLKGQKPQRSPCEEDAARQRADHATSPPIASGKSKISPPRAKLKSEASISFPPSPDHLQRKKIKRPSNVYHLKSGRHPEERGGDGSVDRSAGQEEGDLLFGREPADEYAFDGDMEAPGFSVNEAQQVDPFGKLGASEVAAIEAELAQSQQSASQSVASAEWQEHPITKTLNAYMDLENPLNPVKVIADSLLPLHARTSTPVESEELPIKPLPAEPDQYYDGMASGVDARETFWDFWLGHQEQMRKQCLRLMAGNVADAEDALSNAMLRASQKFPNYADSIVNGKAWLRKLVYNVCMDHYRQDRMTEYRAFDQESDIPQSGAMFTEKPQSPEDKALSREQMNQLDECIEGLSSNLRVPLYLRCVEGWSYPDIAAELDLKTDTVRKRIQLARDHLRRSNIR